MRHSFFPFAILLMLQSFAGPTLAQSPITLTIDSFEEPDATAGIVTTHSASLSVTAASPQAQAGKQAINKTIKQNTRSQPGWSSKSRGTHGVSLASNNQGQ